MKGMILAGGNGERLSPITRAVSKQLLPVYDKPMVYYPLSTLLSAGIRDILIITTEKEQAAFRRLLGTGEQLGVRFSFAVQKEPRGLAEAFLIGEDFIGGEDVALILGDNLFFGVDFLEDLPKKDSKMDGALIFGYRVKNPQNYGVISIDEQGAPVVIEEKPKNPQSRYAVPGLYFYDKDVTEIARTIQPSKRGELEITDLNNAYLRRGKLKVRLLKESTVWMDAGTPDSLLEAANFIAAFQHRQESHVACVEETAYRMGYIDEAQLRRLAQNCRQTAYGQYLRQLAERKRR